MDNKIKNFIFKIAKYYSIILGLSVLMYSFTRHNLICDFTAKKFTKAFSDNNISVTHEIAEERRVVFQNVIQKKGKHFRYLIIGSSRVMQFGELAGFKNALNLGVSGANLNDIKFLYELTRKNNITYDTIIFDFNPWLAISNSDNRYKQFDYYHRLKNALFDIVKFNYNYKDLITILGLFNNYQSSFKTASNQEIVNHTNFIKLKDGSIQQKKLTQKDRKLQINSFVKGLYQMQNFYLIDNSLLCNTVSLFNSASSYGKCLVTLTPFHENIFRLKSNDNRVKNILILEQQLIESKRFFQIFGSFNPNNIKVKESDFLDGFHLKESAIHKIFDCPIFFQIKSNRKGQGQRPKLISLRFKGALPSAGLWRSKKVFASNQNAKAG